MRTTILSLLLMTMLIACGSVGGIAPMETTTATPIVEPSNPIVEPSAPYLAMDYSSGGSWTFDNADTMPYKTSSVQRKTSWDAGSITFSVTGLAYDKLPHGKDYFLFMAKLVTPNGKEGNFQYNIADLVPRLISQRFDGTCSRFCEHQSHGGVNWNAAETYSFTFTWDASTVSLEVRDSSGNVVHSGSVPTDGAYAGVEWIRVGNGVLPPYPGVDGEITIINPTLE